MDEMSGLCGRIQPLMYSSVYDVPPLSYMRYNSNGVRTQPGRRTPGSHRVPLRTQDSRVGAFRSENDAELVTLYLRPSGLSQDGYGLLRIVV